MAGSLDPERWAWDEGFRIALCSLHVLLGFWSNIARDQADRRDQIHADLVPLRHCETVARDWQDEPTTANALRCLSAARTAWALGDTYELRHGSVWRHMAGLFFHRVSLTPAEGISAGFTGDLRGQARDNPR